ncbi:MAG: alpha/beta fold hydrolase [Deltaproteobacteria bacterium]|nr:alpha/beta fold hydrolase [Deltaproteobacteria bacterium]
MNRWLSVLCLSVVMVLGCGSGGGSGAGDLSDTAQDAAGPGGFVLEVACDDTIDSIYSDPGSLPDAKGAIIRCAPDGVMTAAQIQARADEIGYTGKPLASGARVYRVLYRTERGNGAPGYSSALVYLPDAPLADKLPVLVASHGSRGQAAACAPSLNDPAASYVHIDFERQVLPLVGAGFAVIAPDLAGYANFGAAGNPPSGYLSAADEAKSTLDGARALRNMVPSSLTGDVVITGHSQGGHSALSALAMSQEYGAGGKLAAVVAYAPVWFSFRMAGSIFLMTDMTIANSPGTVGVAVWYTYTSGELYDGPGGGLAPFQEDKQAAIKKFVDETCWSKSYPALEALGTTLNDIFSKEFISAIVSSAALGFDCKDKEPAKSICEKWISRYLGDRPHITGEAAQVPILLAYGGKDTTIPPDQFQCGIDRLADDQANVTQCYLPESGHGILPAMAGEHAADWIAHVTLGTPMTTSCPSDKILPLDGDGNPIPCMNPPPND